MVYQQYVTAVKEAYAGRPNVDEMAKTAESYRQWLESLEIDDTLRAGLVEPIQTIEEAFKDLLSVTE
jgi:hypothetical protein